MKQYASFRKVQGEEIKSKMAELENLNVQLDGQKKEKQKLLTESEKQKQLLEKRASLKLSLSDVFYTTKIDAYTILNGYGEQFYQSRDTRVGTLSFSYRFGRSQVASSRRAGAGRGSHR